MIIDLFSRKVIAHKISKKNSTQLLTATFKMAHEERHPPSGLIFHSNRGAQYTSHRFQQLNPHESRSQPNSKDDKPLFVRYDGYGQNAVPVDWDSKASRSLSSDARAEG